MFAYKVAPFTKKDAFGGKFSGIALMCERTRAWTLVTPQEADDLLALVADKEFDAANEAAQDILITDRALVLDDDGEWKSSEDASDDAQERFQWAEHYRIERANVLAR